MAVHRIITPVGPWRFLTPVEPTLLGDAARFTRSYIGDTMWEYVPATAWTSVPFGELPATNRIERIRPLDESAHLVVTEVHLEMAETAAFVLSTYMGHYGPAGTIVPRPMEKK